MTAPEHSRRSSPRVTRQERVFVRILDSETHPELRGTMGRCTTADLSAGGLRLLVDQPVEPGSRLDLWLKLAEHPGTFLLSGEVRWTAPGELDGEHVAGVELVADGVETAHDRAEWTAVLEALTRRR